MAKRSVIRVGTLRQYKVRYTMKEESTEQSVDDIGKTSAETKHQRPRRAGHVSFSPSVIERPATSRVTVVEEHGVYIDALGRRSTIDGEIGNNNGGDAVRDIPTCAVAAGKERVSRSADAADSTFKHEKGHVGFAIETKKDDKQAESQSSDDVGSGESVQYDSLTINLGLLKCGYRYQTIVPIHGQDEKETDSEMPQEHNIVEIGESLDPDLEVEAISNPFKGDRLGMDESPAFTLRDHIQIRIAARRPGKYQTSFSVIATIATTNNQGSVQKSKHIVSVRVNATLLGKDQGKPQLKTNITKLGKLVGYDSDEETEWQGFPESSSEDEANE